MLDCSVGTNITYANIVETTFLKYMFFRNISELFYYSIFSYMKILLRCTLYFHHIDVSAMSSSWHILTWVSRKM